MASAPAPQAPQAPQAQRALVDGSSDEDEPVHVDASLLVDASPVQPDAPAGRTSRTHLINADEIAMTTDLQSHLQTHGSPGRVRRILHAHGIVPLYGPFIHRREAASEERRHCE